MDELSKMLLHGTAGLRSAEEAMGGDLGAALRDRAVSEWAAEDQPAYRPVRPYRGPASTFRFRLWLGVIASVALLVLILIN